MISISVTLAVLFFVILGALFGFVKGFKKSVLRLITVVIAAILAYFVSVPITGLFVTKNNVYSLVEMFGATETYNELIAASPAAEELVCALLASVIATMTFFAISLPICSSHSFFIRRKVMAVSVVVPDLEMLMTPNFLPFK